MRDCDFAVLLSNPWFASLPAEVRGELCERGRQHPLEQEQLLVSRGESATAWYAVLSGAMRVGNCTPEGHHVLLTMLKPGQWFGELSLLDGQPRSHDVFAHVPTQIHCVAAADFDDILTRYPSFARALLCLQVQRLRDLFGGVEDLATLPLEPRMARRLLEYADTYGTAASVGRRIELRLPQETLAHMMGVSRQRVNQTLSSWCKQGLITQHYGTIVILNEDKLHSITAACNRSA